MESSFSQWLEVKENEYANRLTDGGAYIKNPVQPDFSFAHVQKHIVLDVTCFKVEIKKLFVENDQISSECARRYWETQSQAEDNCCKPFGAHDKMSCAPLSCYDLPSALRAHTIDILIGLTANQGRSCSYKKERPETTCPRA